MSQKEPLTQEELELVLRAINERITEIALNIDSLPVTNQAKFKKEMQLLKSAALKLEP